MKRSLAAAVALGLALVQAASAELPLLVISVTSTSQTKYFRPAEVVGLCNLGADPVFFRLFWQDETPGAATTASHSLPAGTAEAPYCWSTPLKPATRPAYWYAISIVADTGDTATVHVQTE